MPSQLRLEGAQRRSHRRQRRLSALAFTALLLCAVGVVIVELLT